MDTVPQKISPVRGFRGCVVYPHVTIIGKKKKNNVVRRRPLLSIVVESKNKN